MSRTLYAVSRSATIWRALAQRFLTSSRPLCYPHSYCQYEHDTFSSPIDKFPPPVLNTLKPSILYTSVLRTHRLLKNWTSDHPRPTEPIRLLSIRPGIEVFGGIGGGGGIGNGGDIASVSVSMASEY